MPTRRLLLLLLVAGCSDRATTGDAIRDSAGVRIREYRSAPSDLAEWTVDTLPALTLSAYGPDSAALLLSPVGAMRTTSGELLVADRGASSVKLFDSQGRLIRSFGRAGAGPGEFDYIADLAACGADTAYVEDIGNSRVLRIAPTGSMSLLAFGFRPQRLPFSSACTRSGHLVMVDWPDLSTPLEPGPYRPTVAVASGTLSHPTSVALGVFPGTEMVVKGRGISPRALGRWLRIAATDSMRWLSVDDGPYVRGYDVNGKLRLLVNPALAVQPVPKNEWEWQRQRAMDSAGAETGRERVGQLFDAAPAPDQLPWVHALIADTDGLLWVHPFPSSQIPNPDWRILASDGTWHARIQLPTSLTGIWEIGRDYILGFRENSEGELVVVLYNLHRVPHGA